VEDAFANILFILFLCGITVLAGSLFFYYQLLKRRAFLEMAKQLGFRYHYSSYAIPWRFGFLRQQRRGRGRNAFNVLFGRYGDFDVVVFDYMFKTGLGTQKKRHYGSFAVMYHGRDCPSLRVYPKGMLSVLGQIVGYEEIFFDGCQPLSERFSVFSTDEDFARNMLVKPLIDYLLRHPELSLEIDPLWLACGMQDCLVPEDIPRRLKQLDKMRSVLSL
jgi:hypothetical protein